MHLISTATFFFAFSLRILAQTTSTNQVRVLYLQKSAIPSAESFARLKASFPVLQDFTVCYRIRMHRFREESTLMSYAVSGNKDNELRMDHRMSGYKVSIHSTWAKTDIVSPLTVWSHYCITYVSLTEEWQIFEDGILKAEGFLPPYEGPLEGNGAYIIGQEQDSFGGDFQRDQSFSGEITQLNFWSRKLPPEKIMQISGCEQNVEGDILAWSEMEWDINGEAEWIWSDVQLLCYKPSRFFQIFSSRLSLSESTKLCQVVGGRIAVPQTTRENEEIYAMSNQFAGFCSGFRGNSYLWLGATDEDNEREWRYIGTTTPLKWEGPWRGAGPNGGTVENCMVMLYGDFPGRWSDIACLETYYFCAPCEFDGIVRLFLKGPVMCSTSPFNYEYFIDGEREGKPVIAGTLHSEMTWENDTQSWVLRSLKNENAAMRYIPENSGQYPFGKKTWIVDSPICGYKEGDFVNMTLSACSEGQFTCQDGTCIPLTKRCDLRLDCSDQSDEADCYLTDVPHGYKNIIPPPPTDPPNPLNISFIISIISFPAIKTQDLTFEANMFLSLRWKDRRVQYQNLKDLRSLNLLSQKEVETLWTPRIFFQNAFGNIFTNLGEGSRIECLPQGKSRPGPINVDRERNIFSGLETDLEMGQYYSATYSCEFDLLMFPFDSQLCSMQFTLISASSDYMILVSKSAKYSGRRNLIEYAIGDLSANHSVTDSFSSIKVDVRFMRRYGFYLLTLYIPSVLLVSIAYATLFFNPGDFNSRIVVALTALLVLSSLFTQTSNSLPKTSYFKLVDVWLFFSTLIIFFVILFQTLAEYFSFESLAKAKVKSTTRILKISPPNATSNTWVPEEENKYHIAGFPLYIVILYTGRLFIPSLYLLFNLIYWGTSLSYLSENVWPYEIEDEV